MRPVRYGQYAENPLFPKRRNRKSLISIITFFFVCVVVFSFLLWGSWFRVSLIAVAGNEYLQTHAIERGAFEALEKKYLWVFPKNNTLFFSKSALEHALLVSLGTSHALETVTVTPNIPAGLTVTVKERIPNLQYVINGQRYYLDRTGVITERVETGRVNEKFPILHDQNSRSVTVGDLVASEATISYLFSFDENMTKAGILMKDYYIPPISCFAFQKPDGEQGSNANTNTDSSNINVNTNLEDTPVSRLPELVKDVCKGDNAFLQNKELRARSNDGWQVYTRTDEDATAHVERLLFVFQKKGVNLQTLRYIDLRFGDSVVYQ